MQRISIIIPTFNYAQFLQASVTSVLQQADAGCDLEVIVVDDGSTDESREVLSHFTDPRLHVVHKEKAGIGAARNTGVSHARGDLIAFLDADDYWRNDKIVRAVDALTLIDAPTVFFSMMQEFLDPTLIVNTGALPQVRLLKGLSASCCVLRRDDFDQVGAFDESLTSGEFIDWYLRAQTYGLGVEIDPEPLVYRRIHSINRDRASRESSRAYPRILLREIQRRRIDG